MATIRTIFIYLCITSYAGTPLHGITPEDVKQIISYADEHAKEQRKSSEYIKEQADFFVTLHSQPEIIAFQKKKQEEFQQVQKEQAKFLVNIAGTVVFAAGIVVGFCIGRATK